MPHRPSVRALLKQLHTRLLPQAGELAQFETETILMHALGCSRQELFLDPDLELSPTVASDIDAWVANRLGGVPLPYVLGVTYFHSLELQVSPSVLIPRPDTEVLVETVLSQEPDSERFFVDMGTGSGCITAVLLHHRRSWTAVASDISPAALAVARGNLRQSNAWCVCADQFSAFHPGDRHFDFVVSNPPYVTVAECAQLDKSVREHEPHIALDGGCDGLDFYRSIAAHAESVLKPRGRVYLEVGAGQAPGVCDILREADFAVAGVVKDLAGHERVVHARSNR